MQTFKTKTASVRFMKTYLVLLLGCLCFVMNAKDHYNQIGLGLGSISLQRNSPIDRNLFDIRSPFFDTRSNNQSYQTINTLVTPNLYFSKKITTHLIGRFNASYAQTAYFIDYTGWILEPGGLPSNRTYYNNINYIKNIYFNIGVQYNFNFKKIKIYPAIEYGADLNFYKDKAYYTTTSNIYQSNIEITKSNYINHTVNLLLGIEYHFGKRTSISYEFGLFQNFFSPVARLSANYDF